MIGSSIISAIQEKIKNKLGDYSNILGVYMNGDYSKAFYANSQKNFLGSRKTFMVNRANENFKFYLSNLEDKSEPYNYCKEDETFLEVNKCVKRLQKEKKFSL